MIAYVQSDTLDQWVERVGEWVASLVANKVSGWSDGEALHRVCRPDPLLMRLESAHVRTDPLAAIAITHLWIDMISGNASQ